MIYINVKNKLWKKYSENKCNLWVKGYIYSHNINLIIEKFKKIEKNEIESFVKNIQGHFALIVQTERFTFISTDKIRSTPIFFVQIKNHFFIDPDPKNLIELDQFDKTIDESAKLEISMSGYTIGNKTLFKNLHSLKAGELVIFQDNFYQYIQYYKYFNKIINKSFDEYLEELGELTIKIFQKMIKNIGNRQIVVPLSGGHDSRLVVSILKYLGVKNLKCYSYGTPGNFEAETAKIVAKKLEYDWKFIPLSHKSEKKFYLSKQFTDYYDYTETYSSTPYYQGLSTIQYLKNSNWIEKDAVFVNGNTGDFISGGHIDPKIESNINVQNILSRKENILNHLVEKHFSLWGYLKTKNNISKIKNNLWNEITKACGELSEFRNDHQFYEYSEFIDRQSKHVVFGQMIYEYYGHEWRLPLWDDEYLFFWQKIPINCKLRQKLYKEMLKKNNFGSVWGENIKINKKTISPKWVIPLRFICKIPFSLFGQTGKKKFRDFDISFLYYFRDLTHMMDITNYSSIILNSFKKPRNHVSWQSRDYLEKLLKTISKIKDTQVTIAHDNSDVLHLENIKKLEKESNYVNISCIIPHYNNSRLLKKLLTTIPKIKDIQIIVVDDNSNESHLEQINKFKKDFNFELYQNTRAKGAGACRNIGIEKSKGRWIIFSDSDDFFTEGFYKNVNEYFTSKYDAIYFTPTSVFLDTNIIADRHLPFKSIINAYLKDRSKKNEFSLRYKFIAPWSIMIKKKFINDNKIMFDEIITSNDVMFSIKIGYFVKNFDVSEKNIYCVVRRKDSLTNNHQENFFDIRLNTRIKRFNFLKKNLNKDEFKKYLKPYLALKNLEFLYQSYKNFGTRKLKKVHSLYKKNNIIYFSFNFFNIYKVIKYIIIKMLLNIIKKKLIKFNVKN